MNRREQGFTLIELIVVFTMIGILVGLALPQFKNAATKARESTLKESLFTLRKLIDQYYTDKSKYPASLQALVDEGYLRNIPNDPMTGSTATWTEVREEPKADEPITTSALGITDIRSGSPRTGLDGTAYNTW